MTSVARDVAGYLAGEGLGAVGGSAQWALYIGKEPLQPDDAVTIYDTGGPFDNPDGPYYSPTIQVRVRSHSYDDGYTRAEAIRDQLIIPTARVIGGWLYTGFWLLSDVVKIGTDDKNRELFTVNFQSRREAVSTA